MSEMADLTKCVINSFKAEEKSAWKISDTTCSKLTLLLGAWLASWAVSLNSTARLLAVQSNERLWTKNGLFNQPRGYVSRFEITDHPKSSRMDKMWSFNSQNIHVYIQIPWLAYLFDQHPVHSRLLFSLDFLFLSYIFHIQPFPGVHSKAFSQLFVFHP